MAPLVIPLTLSKKDFQTNVESARLDMERLAEEVKDTSAELTIMQREARAAGGGTDAFKAKIEETRKSLQGLKQDLLSAKTDFKILSEAQPEGPKFAPEHRARRGIVEAESSLLEDGDPAQKVVNAISGFSESMEMSLGPVLAIAAFVTLATKINEAAAETKKLRAELDAVGAPMPSARGASIEEINERLKAAAETTEQLEEAQGSVMHVLAGAFEKADQQLGRKSLAGQIVGQNPFSMLREFGRAWTAAQEDDENNVKAARTSADVAGEKLVDKSSSSTDLNRRASQGDESAAIDRIADAAKEAKDAIDANGNIPARNRAALKQNVDKDADTKTEAEKRRQDLAREQVNLEGRLLAIKKEGADADVKAAEARLESARVAFSEGPKYGTAAQESLQKIFAAQEELRIAVRTSEERKEELGIRAAIAVLTNNADQAHLLALSLEEQKLRSRLASSQYTPDEKLGFSTDLDENLAAQKQAARATISKQNQEWLQEQAATYQRGVDGQRKSIQDRQLALGAERDANTSGTDANGQRVFTDGALGAQQDEQMAQLTRALEDLNFTQQQHVTALNQTTTQLEQHGRVTPGAKKEEISASYDARIAEAQHNNDGPGVAALSRQKDLALEDVDIDEEMMTPAEKRKRARQNAKRQAAQDRVEQRKRNHAKVEASNASMGDGFSVFGGPTHMPDRTIGHHDSAVQPDRSVPAPSAATSAHADAAKAGFKGSLGTVESLLSKLVDQCKFHEE